MRLESMTDFVLEQTELLYDKNQSKLIHNIVNYAQFLKQPLKLEMFVPIDNDGNVLKKPTFDAYMQPKEMFKQDDAYQKAKSKVLFKGFKLKDEYLMYHDFMCMMIYELEGKTVENLIVEIPNNYLKLTQNAIKRLVL